MRRPLDYIFLYLKALCIGATGVFQGISGGSMALLLGVYQEFIFSVRAIDKRAFHLLQEKNLSGFWKKVNGPFLLPFFAGLITGLLTLRALLGYLFHQHFIFISSFLFSLVLIAALLMLRSITRWRFLIGVFLLAGIGASYLMTLSPGIAIPDNPWYTFLSGIGAGATFVLPGLSGVFILMFIGKYQYILTSFDSLEMGVMAFFIAGGILGLTLMARLIGNLLTVYFNQTMALLAGLMIGSLNKIWPWREVYEYATTLQGKRVPALDKSILPWQYMELTGKDPQVFYAILLMALGVLMVVIVEKVAARLKTKS